MSFENNARGSNSPVSQPEHLEMLRSEILPSFRGREGHSLEQGEIVQSASASEKIFDWLGPFWRRKETLEKTPYLGARDGSPKAVLGVAKERLHDEIYRANHMQITKRGRLGCAIAVGSVFRDAGVVDKNGKPLPLRPATVSMRNDLIDAGWKLVEKSREELKPGYFVEAFGAFDGSGAHHAIILGEAAKRGQKNPITGKNYTPGEPMAWNNNDRTRPDKPGEEKLKWWSLESLSEATSEYADYLVLRPPLAGEKTDPQAERKKLNQALRLRR